MSNPSIEARPAATLIVAREQAGALHFLMTERSAAMEFGAGAWVFPGGAVDPEDVALAQSLSLALDIGDLAGRIAAIRETIEECGMVLAAGERQPAREAVVALRQALKEGRSLAASSETGVSFNFESLVPFARWCPPAGAAFKRFDTRFYLAIAGEGCDDLHPDGNETVKLGWHRAQEVLDRADAGKGRLLFPTRRNLERLAQFRSVDELIGHAHAHPVRTISPQIENREGVDHLCIPEGLGYPVTAQPLALVPRA